MYGNMCKRSDARPTMNSNGVGIGGGGKGYIGGPWRKWRGTEFCLHSSKCASLTKHFFFINWFEKFINCFIVERKWLKIAEFKMFGKPTRRFKRIRRDYHRKCVLPMLYGIADYINLIFCFYKKGWWLIWFINCRVEVHLCVCVQKTRAWFQFVFFVFSLLFHQILNLV